MVVILAYFQRLVWWCVQLLFMFRSREFELRRRKVGQLGAIGLFGDRLRSSEPLHVRGDPGSLEITRLKWVP